MQILDEKSISTGKRNGPKMSSRLEGGGHDGFLFSLSFFLLLRYVFSVLVYSFAVQ